MEKGGHNNIIFYIIIYIIYISILLDDPVCLWCIFLPFKNVNVTDLISFMNEICEWMDHFYYTQVPS